MEDVQRLMSFENSMEPYAQLVRSLLPRAASVSLFDSTGKLLWTSAQATNPDLFALVLQGISQVEADIERYGQDRRDRAFGAPRWRDRPSLNAPIQGRALLPRFPALREAAHRLPSAAPGRP